MNEEYVLLDTKVFDQFIAEKDELIARYTEIENKYKTIVETLLQDWVGEGASAFEDDAKKVKSNIAGIYDILKVMCDTLTDCRQVFGECDTKLGEINKDPQGSA